jgi:UDP-GlcNAc:undecaprenyl-phosphate GlcNAc-1-phosphate transferase
MRLFLAFVAGLSITAALIPLLIRLAPSIGLTDPPGPRKVHTMVVPRVGGIAMACGIFASLTMFLELTPSVLAILCSIAILVAFGIWDDHSNLGYRTKFLGQVLAAGCCVFFGGPVIDTLTFATSFDLPSPLANLLTVIFLIGATNAVNLSDGLDGLAGGMALLCCAAIAVFGVSSNNILVVTFALLTVGATLGFLRFNTYPARVFMGDCGSQVLGFSMGVLSVAVTQDESSALSAALPLLLVGMPVIDTGSVMYRRFRAGRSPFESDRDHLHHRLLGLGLRHAEAVALVYALQVLLCIVAFVLRYSSDLLIIAVFVAFSLTVLGSVEFASRTGWHTDRWRGVFARRISWSAGQIELRQRASMLLAAVVAVALAVYSADVLIRTPRVSGDIGLLGAALLGFSLLASLAQRSKQTDWGWRAIGYVTIALIVYLDQLTIASGALAGQAWIMLSIVIGASILRMLIDPKRDFRVSSLDLLIVAVAIAIANIPGSFGVPSVLTVGLTKALLLLYALEFSLAGNRRRIAIHWVLVGILIILTARSTEVWFS